MCSVANKVELAFPVNGGNIQGVLNVELTWSGKTDQDTFKCDGGTEGDVDAMMWTDHRGPLSEAMAWPEQQILPFVFCTSDDNCFKQDLKTGEPWYENKHCTPLDWPIGCDPTLQGPSNPKLNCPPSLGAPKPFPQGRQYKALSIIYQRMRVFGADLNSWLFFPSDYGVSSACRDEKDAIHKSVLAPGKVDNPPWPGGTYPLRLFGMYCEYKNDGKTAGALFCEDGTPGAQLRSRQIQCKEELTRWSGKAEDCPKPFTFIEKLQHHRVVTCDW